MKNKDIAKIVSRALNNKEKYFEQLYDAVWDTIYYLAYSMMGNPHDAEDVSQEVLVKIYRNLEKLEEPMAFNQWMNRIVMNTCNNALTKRATSEKQVVPEDVREFTPAVMQQDENTEALPVAQVDQSEFREMIMTLVRDLPAKQKEAVLLYYYEELPVTEIAAILQRSESAVKSQLFHARNSLRKEIEKMEAKQQIQLHSMGAIPTIGTLLQKNAQEACTSVVKASIWGGITGSTPAAAAAAGASAGMGAVIKNIIVMVISGTVIAGALAGGLGEKVIPSLQGALADTSHAAFGGDIQNAEQGGLETEDELFTFGDGTDTPEGMLSSGKDTTGGTQSAQNGQDAANSNPSGGVPPAGGRPPLTGGTPKEIYPSDVTGIRIQSAPQFLEKGAAHTFNAVVTGVNNPSQKVKWSVTGASAGTTINEQGILQVASSETASAVTVVATSLSDTSKADRVTVSIKPTLPAAMQGLTGGAEDVGKTFSADGYTWQVIKADANGNLLITTTSIISTTAFGVDAYTSYAGSSLNGQINSFYTNRLKTLQDFAQPVAIQTEADRNAAAITGGLSYVDAGGSKTAFALSVSEVNTCFGSDEAKKAGGGSGWYWLRSPGNTAESAAGVGTDGILYSYDVTTSSGGVRPALWISVG